MADTARQADTVDAWLTPGVAGIGTASLLADVGHKIPTALLPSFLTSTLGAPASALGATEGVSDALAGVARFGGGALADEPDRRRTVAVGGYTTTAVLSAGIGATTAAWQVGVLRAGAWTARGLRVPARNALLADVVNARAYGRAYGFERAMDNLGAILGPLAAIALIAAVGSRWAIGLSVIPGLLAAAAIVYAIRHTPAPQTQHRRPLRIRVRPVLTGTLRPLFAGIGAFELGNCAATLLILRATELFEPGRTTDAATTAALTLYLTYNAAATLTSLAAGRHTDRVGATRVLSLGVAAFALAYLGFTRDTSAWLGLLPWFVFAGIGIGCVETAEHAAVAARAPADPARLRVRASRRHPEHRQPCRQRHRQHAVRESAGDLTTRHLASLRRLSHPVPTMTCVAGAREHGTAMSASETASSVVVRLQLFVSSYTPLWVIAALRQDLWWLAGAFWLLTVVGVVAAVMVMVDVHRLAPGPYRVADVADRGSEVAGYLATYLLPFVMVSDPSGRDIAAYVVFFVVLAVVYVQSDMLAINPLLYVAGRRVTAVVSEGGLRAYLICRQPPQPGQVVLAAELGHGVLVETRGRP